MPCTLKICIIQATGILVDRVLDGPIDTYVEVTFGDDSHRTRTVRNSLSPEYNESFRIEVANDYEVQDTPLLIELFEDGVGLISTLLLDLSILLRNRDAKYSGYLPMIDSLKGIKAMLRISAIAEIANEMNYFQSEFDVVSIPLFSSTTPPPKYLYSLDVIIGLVDDIQVVFDPEYEWKDLIRSHRTSNEARLRTLHSASMTCVRQIIKKARRMKANAVLGFSFEIDYEGDSTDSITIRAYGTAVKLSSLEKSEEKAPAAAVDGRLHLLPQLQIGVARPLFHKANEGNRSALGNNALLIANNNDISASECSMGTTEQVPMYYRVSTGKENVLGESEEGGINDESHEIAGVSFMDYDSQNNAFQMVVSPFFRSSMLQSDIEALVLQKIKTKIEQVNLKRENGHGKGEALRDGQMGFTGGEEGSVDTVSLSLASGGESSNIDDSSAKLVIQGLTPAFLVDADLSTLNAAASGLVLSDTFEMKLEDGVIDTPNENLTKLQTNLYTPQHQSMEGGLDNSYLSTPGNDEDWGADEHNVLKLLRAKKYITEEEKGNDKPKKRNVKILTINTLPFDHQQISIVCARSVRMLNIRTTLTLRQQLWAEIRDEIRQHATSLGCNVVLGYTEKVVLFENTMLLTAMGTACTTVSYSLGREMNEEAGKKLEDGSPPHSLIETKGDTDTYIEQEKTGAILSNEVYSVKSRYVLQTEHLQNRIGAMSRWMMDMKENKEIWSHMVSLSDVIERTLLKGNEDLLSFDERTPVSRGNEEMRQIWVIGGMASTRARNRVLLTKLSKGLLDWIGLKKRRNNIRRLYVNGNKKEVSITSDNSECSGARKWNKWSSTSSNASSDSMESMGSDNSGVTKGSEASDRKSETEEEDGRGDSEAGSSGSSTGSMSSSASLDNSSVSDISSLNKSSSRSYGNGSSAESASPIRMADKAPGAAHFHSNMMHPTRTQLLERKLTVQEKKSAYRDDLSCQSVSGMSSNASSSQIYLTKKKKRAAKTLLPKCKQCDEGKKNNILYEDHSPTWSKKAHSVLATDYSVEFHLSLENRSLYDFASQVSSILSTKEDGESERSYDSDGDDTRTIDSADNKAGTSAKDYPNQDHSSSKKTCYACSPIHLPSHKLEDPKGRSDIIICRLCGAGYVPRLLISTLECPEGLALVGDSQPIEVRAVRKFPKKVTGEGVASAVSAALPFLELSLYRALVSQMRTNGLCCAFGLQIQTTLCSSYIVSIAYATGVRTLAQGIPPHVALRVSNDRYSHYSSHQVSSLKRKIKYKMKHLKRVWKRKNITISHSTSYKNDITVISKRMIAKHINQNWKDIKRATSAISLHASKTHFSKQLLSQIQRRYYCNGRNDSEVVSESELLSAVKRHQKASHKLLPNLVLESKYHDTEDSSMPQKKNRITLSIDDFADFDVISSVIESNPYSAITTPLEYMLGSSDYRQYTLPRTLSYSPSPPVVPYQRLHTTTEPTHALCHNPIQASSIALSAGPIPYHYSPQHIPTAFPPPLHTIASPHKYFSNRQYTCPSPLYQPQNVFSGVQSSHALQSNILSALPSIALHSHIVLNEPHPTHYHPSPPSSLCIRGLDYNYSYSSNFIFCVRRFILSPESLRNNKTIDTFLRQILKETINDIIFHHLVNGLRNFSLCNIRNKLNLIKEDLVEVLITGQIMKNTPPTLSPPPTSPLLPLPLLSIPDTQKEIDKFYQSLFFISHHLFHCKKRIQKKNLQLLLCFFLILYDSEVKHASLSIHKDENIAYSKALKEFGFYLTAKCLVLVYLFLLTRHFFSSHYQRHSKKNHNLVLTIFSEFLHLVKKNVSDRLERENISLEKLLYLFLSFCHEHNNYSSMEKKGVITLRGRKMRRQKRKNTYLHFSEKLEGFFREKVKEQYERFKLGENYGRGEEREERRESGEERKRFSYHGIVIQTLQKLQGLCCRYFRQVFDWNQGERGGEKEIGGLVSWYPSPEVFYPPVLVTCNSSIPGKKILKYIGLVVVHNIKEDSMLTTKKKVHHFYYGLIQLSLFALKSRVVALGGNALLNCRVNNISTQEDNSHFYIVMTVSGDCALTRSV